LEREKDLRIVVNVLDRMEDGFLTTISTFVGDLSKRTPGIKVLLTCGSVGDPGNTLVGLCCINIQYDKERKGLISRFPNSRVSNVANKCRVP
jgi:hypothetical protein